MINVIVRDLGDVTEAIEKLIAEAVGEATADRDNELEALIDEKNERICELEETIQNLYTDLDERNAEIKELYKEIMND